MMNAEQQYETVLGSLRAKLVGFKPGNKIFDEIVAPRDAVFAEYRPIFSLDHVPHLTREEFTGFLYFENNRHWSGLHRQGLRAAEDMGRLRESLFILLDETRPMADRFGEAIQMVHGMGKGTATAILTIAYPERYGVWNNTSETGLRQLDAWPTFEKGASAGARYEKINSLLQRLSSDLGMDLWTLDAAWWFLAEPEQLPKGTEGVVAEMVRRFGLERQLEEFLLENWGHTPLGKEWAIYTTEDDPEAGNQFPTDVGPIDILARHKTEPRLLVVELKRNQSSDQTVGQVLRYMGWVSQHVAGEGDSVEALIIAHRPDKATRYALLMVPGVRMMTYEVDFRLQPLQPL